MIVQANINHYGIAAVAAITAMTFTGQNYGAGKKNRIMSGIKYIFLLEFLTWLIGASICVLFGEAIFKIFTDDVEVINYAKLCMLFDIPCYWALASSLAMTSVIRGMGRSKAASIIFVANMCGMRQLWILFANAQNMGVQGVLLSYPISWILTLAGTLLYTLYLKKLGEFNENTDKREKLLFKYFKEFRASIKNL